MRKWLGIGVALGPLCTLAAAAIPLACSSAQVPPFETSDLFCQAKAQAECVVATNCLIPVDTCEATRAALCNAEATAAVSSPSTRQYYQPNAQACLNEIKSAYGQGSKVAFSDLFGAGSIDDVCNRVFQGKATTNTSCESNYDCTNDEVCAPVAAGSTSSVCAEPAPVAAMGFCANPGSECATGTFCQNVSGGAAQCNPRGAMNAACSATQPCLEDLRCLNGNCAPREQIGGACNPDGADPNADCDVTAPFCDPNVGNRCTPGLSFASESADCNAYGLQGGDAGVVTPVVDSGASTEAGGG